MTETDSQTSEVAWSSDNILEKKARNSKQPINRLPPELLSRIFAVGDEEQRSKRARDEKYYGFQDLAVVSDWHTYTSHGPTNPI